MGRIVQGRYDAALGAGSSGARNIPASLTTAGDDPLLMRLARHLQIGTEVFFLPFEKLSRHAKSMTSDQPAGLNEAVQRIGDEDVRDCMLHLLHRMRQAASETRAFPAVAHSRRASVSEFD